MTIVDFFVLLLVGCNVLLVAWTFHKVRRIHLIAYQTASKVERISSKHLLDHFQQLQALENLRCELGFENGLPPTRGWAASPDFLLLISRHAREARPDVVVECSSGTSTVVLARCMQLNGAGHVYSLDHDLEFAEATRVNLIRYGLSDWATVVDAPLRLHDLKGETWNWYSDENLQELRIDMLVIDGPPLPLGPKIRYPAGPILFPKLNTGATVFLDDAAREDEQVILERWVQEFPKFRTRHHHCEKGCVTLQLDDLSLAQSAEM